MSGELPKNESSFRRNNSARKSNPSNRKFLYLLLCGICLLSVIGGTTWFVVKYKPFSKSFDTSKMTMNDIIRNVYRKKRIEIEKMLGDPDKILTKQPEKTGYLTPQEYRDMIQSNSMNNYDLAYIYTRIYCIDSKGERTLRHLYIYFSSDTVARVD